MEKMATKDAIDGILKMTLRDMTVEDAFPDLSPEDHEKLREIIKGAPEHLEMIQPIDYYVPRW